MEKIIKQIKKDGKIIAVSIILGIIIAFIFSIKSYSERVSSEISEAVIRFHVLANSDEEFDQQLKLKVRDEILLYLSDNMGVCYDRNEAEKYLSSHIEEINRVAEKTIKAEGFNYSVRTELSDEHYPVRYYGNAAFPEGDYKSLRVIIGSGKGHNWWCVMYPPLCLNGESLEYADADMLRDVLTEDGYEVVVLSSDNVVPEIKFKTVEWWNSITN